MINKDNIVKCYDQSLWGSPKDRFLQYKKVRQLAALDQISDLEVDVQSSLNIREAYNFNRRITCISWHTRIPYLFAIGCKGGDFLIQNKSDYDDLDQEFKTVYLFDKGNGPGGALFSMKFDPNRNNLMYKASLDGTFNRLDFVNDKSYIYHDTNDYALWFTAMDVNFSTNVIAAGTNKGRIYFHHTEGQKVFEGRLHKDKILHCEFNKRDISTLVTASLDSTIKFWDIRYFDSLDPKPFKVLSNINGNKKDFKANTATFNPLDSSLLLASDQEETIAVFQGPLWDKKITFKHEHRKFQHLTPMKATWHPYEDIIVIGSYPKVEKDVKISKVPKPICFFDAHTSKLLSTLQHFDNGIMSINVFNSNAEYLASATGMKTYLWKRPSKGETFENRYKNITRSKRKNEKDFDILDEEEDIDINEISKKFKKPPKKKRAKKNLDPTYNLNDEDFDEIKKKKLTKAAKVKKNIKKGDDQEEEDLDEIKKKMKNTLLPLTLALEKKKKKPKVADDEDSDDDFMIPPVSKKKKPKNVDEEDSDDDFIVPPVSKKMNKNVKNKKVKEDSDDEENDEKKDDIKKKFQKFAKVSEKKIAGSPAKSQPPKITITPTRTKKTSPVTASTSKTKKTAPPPATTTTFSNATKSTKRKNPETELSESNNTTENNNNTEDVGERKGYSLRASKKIKKSNKEQ